MDEVSNGAISEWVGPLRLACRSMARVGLVASSVLISGAWAQDLYSKETPGEDHKPADDPYCLNMDYQLVPEFIRLLHEKLSKRTYIPFRQKYGQGYLVIGMQAPFFDGDTITLMKAACRREDWSDDLGCFASVFIGFRSQRKLVFYEWRIGTQH